MVSHLDCSVELLYILPPPVSLGHSWHPFSICSLNKIQYISQAGRCIGWVFLLAPDHLLSFLPELCSFLFLISCSAKQYSFFSRSTWWLITVVLDSKDFYLTFWKQVRSLTSQLRFSISKKPEHSKIFSILIVIVHCVLACLDAREWHGQKHGCRSNRQDSGCSRIPAFPQEFGFQEMCRFGI